MRPKRKTLIQRKQLEDYIIEDFPGGPVVKTPHSQCRAMGLIPGRGIKIPHAALPTHALPTKKDYTMGKPKRVLKTKATPNLYNHLAQLRHPTGE